MVLLRRLKAHVNSSCSVRRLATNVLTAHRLAVMHAEIPSHRARPELDDSPRQREQLHRTASSSGAFLPPPSPDRAARRGHVAAAAAATAFGSPPTSRLVWNQYYALKAWNKGPVGFVVHAPYDVHAYLRRHMSKNETWCLPCARPRLVSHSSVPMPLLPRASLSAGMVPRTAPAGESLARARQAVMADLASNPPARQRAPLDLPVSFVAQPAPQAWLPVLP